MKWLLLVILCLPMIAYSQSSTNAVQDTLKKPDLTLQKELEEELEAVELKVKKNVFFGEKVKPSWTRNIERNKVVIEEFYIFKEPTAVNKYMQSIYVHDKAIMVGLPYVEYLDICGMNSKKEIVCERIFR